MISERWTGGAHLTQDRLCFNIRGLGRRCGEGGGTAVSIVVLQLPHSILCCRGHASDAPFPLPNLSYLSCVGHVQSHL